MKIGLSLSFCIKDILKGTVDVNEVACIISSCKVQTDEEWEKLVDEYCIYYWDDYESEARALLKTLRDSNRIIMPQLTIGRYVMIYDGHWITQQDNVMEGRPSNVNTLW